MEKRDKREGWLKEIKVGDKVFVDSHYETRIMQVKEITPTGEIIIGNRQFDHMGIEMNTAWHKDKLLEWTQEKENNLIKEKYFTEMCYYLKEYDWKECPFELVESIYNQIKSY